MGGYGSGRPQTRPSVAAAYAWPCGVLIAPALRSLRSLRAKGDPVAAISGLAQWSYQGEVIATARYTVCERGGMPTVLLDYTADGVRIADTVRLAEVRSNLPGNLGKVVLWRCPCGQRAKFLYLSDTPCRWRCRRCVPVVYDSSRNSDRRVSGLLARAVQSVLEDWGDAIDGATLATLSAGQLRYNTGASVQQLALALRVLDRLGMAGGQRAPRCHGSTGRPRSREPPS